MNLLYTPGEGEKYFLFFQTKSFRLLLKSINQAEARSYPVSFMLKIFCVKPSLVQKIEKKLFGVDVDHVPIPANIKEILMEPSPLDLLVSERLDKILCLLLSQEQLVESYLLSIV